MRANRLDESTFDELSAMSGQDLISVFIPTHRVGRQIAQDRIHLKNQLSSVEDALADLGWKPRERSRRLSRARELLDDIEFWEHQDAGLALYIDVGGDIEALSSRKPLEAFGVVMPVYMMRPLIADVHAVHAPVLALTMDEVALYDVSESGVEAMDVHLPSYSEVNWFVDRETQRQQHPDRPGSGRNRHGHRSSTKSDEDLARFLREVDSAIKGFEADSPLIILGDDGMVARFSNHSERTTVSPPSSGITAPFSETQVYEMVAQTIVDMASDRVDAATARARDRLGVDMGSSSVDDALPAAVSGRVAEIVTHREADPVWGRFNESSLEVDAHEERRPGDVDLLDRLIVWARNGGASLVSSEAPVDERAFIATFRY